MKLASIVTKGLYFNCQQCGRCCSSSVEGYIYVFKSDIERLASKFNLSLEDFAAKYLDIVDYTFRIWNENLEYDKHKRLMPTLVLRAEKGKDCVFLKEKNNKKLCEIYEARPFQCEAYPKWTMLMENETTLKETAESCLGLLITPEKIESEKKKGNNIRFFSPDEIEEWTRKERQMERDYYLAMKANNFDIYQVYPFMKNKNMGQIQSDMLPNHV